MTALATSTTHVVYEYHGFTLCFDEFETEQEARNFAEDFGGEVVTADEFRTMTREAEDEPEDFGVLPGIDFPATMYPAF